MWQLTHLTKLQHVVIGQVMLFGLDPTSILKILRQMPFCRNPANLPGLGTGPQYYKLAIFNVC